MHIWDRYNWDSGKETPIPGNQLSWLLDEDEMDDITGMMAPAGPEAGSVPAAYFQQLEDQDGNLSYMVNDSLMGALIESGDAANFDIVGSGNTQSITYRVINNTPPPRRPVAPPSTGSPPRSD